MVPPHPPMTVHEIELLEQELAPLTDVSSPSPVVVSANTAIGLADELGRLLLSFFLVVGVLSVLAIVLTPWLWIAVAVWIGFAVATVVWFLRRAQRRSAVPIASIATPLK